MGAILPRVLLVAVFTLASAIIPAAAHAQADGPPPKRDKGQCELDREWSDARLSNVWSNEGRVISAIGLGYTGQQATSASADLTEAQTQVARVVRVSGLEMNFEMVVDPSTPAAAQIVNGRRIILFDPRFMAQVADRICPDWGATSILAHEVGHHLAGHTLRQTAEPWRDELEADEFSGFALSRLGATQAETTSAAARILPEKPTATHPGRADRLAALVHGWQNAAALINAELTQAKHDRGLLPMRQERFVPGSEGTDASDLALVARIIFYDDHHDYYVTRGGRIDVYDGNRRIVSRKAVPSSADYAWTFMSESGRFDVGYSGRLFIRFPSGSVHEVGVVVSLQPQAAAAPEK